jgi:hypothetical protein
MVISVFYLNAGDASKATGFSQRGKTATRNGKILDHELHELCKEKALSTDDADLFPPLEKGARAVVSGKLLACFPELPDKG